MVMDRRIHEARLHLEECHLRVLRVCMDYPTGEHGTFCGEWIMRRCEQHGVPFHQGWLRKLANVGLLERDDSSRGGNRRYYRLKDKQLLQQFLALQPA